MDLLDNWLFRSGFGLSGFGLFGMMVWGLYLFPLAYLVLRWRAYREQAPADPQLGIKVVLYYFRFLTHQLLLIGLASAAIGVLFSGERGPIFRIAAGLIVGGGSLYAGCVAALYQRTNAAQFPAVGRFFTGAGALVTGLVAMCAWIGFFLALFSPGRAGEVVKILVALMFVYAPAAVLLGRSLLQYSLAAPAAPPPAKPLE